MKRILSLILAFCMVLSLFPAVTVSASTTTESDSPYLWMPEKATQSPWTTDIGGTFAFGAVEKSQVLLSGEDSKSLMTPLTVLTVGGVDALTTPSGDGWSFDAEYATLRLSGAEITGADGVGIYAEGDLKIITAENTDNTVSASDYGIYVKGHLEIQSELPDGGDTLHVSTTGQFGMAVYTLGDVHIQRCADFTAVGGANGICSEAGVTISESKVSAGFTCTFVESMEAQTYAPPAAIIGLAEILIQDKSEVTAEGNGFGIYAYLNKLAIEDSAVNVNADYTGLAAEYDCSIVNSTVTSKSNEPLEILLGIYASAGFGLMANNSLDISKSTVELEGTSAGLLVQGKSTITDSTITASGGYMGVCSHGGMSVGNSSLSADLTFTVEEANAYANTFEMQVPPLGIYLTDDAQFTGSEITVTGSPDGFMAYGMFASTMTLDDSNVSVANAAYGGIVGDMSLVIINCDSIEAQGGYLGISSINLAICNSNIQADATWTDEQIQQMGLPGAFAIQSFNSYYIAGVLTDGEPGRYDLDGSNFFYTILDENGVPLRSVTITAAETPEYTSPTEPEPSETDPTEPSESEPEVTEPTIIDKGICGNKLTWVLTSDGVLTISGEGAMADYSYSTNKRSPWYTYRDSIITVVIDKNITSIGAYAFYYCSKMTSVTIPDSVISIKDNAFYNCSKLTSVVIPDSVTSIGDDAFNACSSLVSLTIPRNVSSIGDFAFSFCTSLTGIHVDENNAHYSSDDSGVLFNKDKTQLLRAPGGISGDYTVPDGVISIDKHSFQHCDSLTGVTIPNSVTSVGNYTFFDCSSLTYVNMGSGLSTIGDQSFSACACLIGFNVDDNNPYISNDEFGVLFNKDKTELVMFPGGISGTYTIPDTVTAIRRTAFYVCENLTGVTIPESVSTIGSGAFNYCYSLSEIRFNGDAPVINSDIFLSVTATAYYPDNNSTWTADVLQSYGGTITWAPYIIVKEIAHGWSGYAQWSLSDNGVLSIYGEGNMKNYGFDGKQPWLDYADQITSVFISEGVTSIGSGAFMNLTKLNSVTLPKSGLTKIGEAAFYGCTSLSEIYIPDGIYTIWSYTFKVCTALKDVRLPKTLLKIDQGAFENCTSLDYIFIPTNTEIIGTWSFKDCSSLKEADMQWADATEIRKGAFKNCTALKKIILPEDIQVLGDSCFYGIGATSFTVPATVTKVEDWCFARAYALNEIVFEGDAPAIGEGAFNKITLTAKYPGNNASWTAEIMQNYGGTVTWTTK